MESYLLRHWNLLKSSGNSEPVNAMRENLLQMGEQLRKALPDLKKRIPGSISQGLGAGAVIGSFVEIMNVPASASNDLLKVWIALYVAGSGLFLLGALQHGSVGRHYSGVRHEISDRLQLIRQHLRNRVDSAGERELYLLDDLNLR